MKKPLKITALVLVLIFLGFFIFRYIGSYKGENTENADFQKMQQANYEKQTQMYFEYLNKLEDQMNRVNKLNDKVAEQQLRYDKILSRWEQQADKMDAILLKLEK